MDEHKISSTEKERQAARRAKKAEAQRQRRARMSPERRRAEAEAQQKRRARKTPVQSVVAEVQKKRGNSKTPERRKAEAEAQRKRRANMTPEQRKAEAEAQRKRRSRKTPEQRRAEAEAQRKRRARMTPEQREACADAQRKRIRGMSQDQLQKLREENAKSKRKSYARMAGMDLNRQNKCKRISAMTLEQFEKRTMEITAKNFVYRTEQSLCVKFSKEVREKIIAEYLEERLAKIAGVSVEERSQQRAIVYAKRRERLVLLTQLEEKTVKSTAKRIKRLILLSTCAMAKNPQKYKAAGTVIHKCLLEIRDVYAEIGNLKNLLKQIVSQAVQNAVKFQIGKNQVPEDIQSLTFVDFSLRLESNTIVQQINTFETLNEKNCDEKNRTKKLVCSICSKEFGTSLGLTIHQKEHISNSNEFECSVCQERFDAYKHMTSHYLQFHSLQYFDFNDEDGNIEIDDEMEKCAHEMDFLFSRKCLICFKTFKKMKVGLQTFSKHIISHHRENKEFLKNFTYICVRCNQPYTFFRNLESHWKKVCFEKWTMEDKNSTEVVCEHCGTKLSNEKSLSTHLHIFHTKGNSHVCEHCGKQLKGESSLKHHISMVHQSVYKFSCEICGKKFKTQSDVRKHAETVHLKVKPHVCKYCSKRFASFNSLNWHENIHTGEKPFQCKLCDKSFTASSSLTIHEGIHDGYKCKICGETCNNYVDLCMHRKLNHRDPNTFVSDPASNKNQIPTSCDICGKSVQGFMALKSHKKLVHVGRDHVCEICGKNYKTFNALVNHKFSHDNLKRFGCSLCGREFRQQTNFYQHKRVAHINEDARMVKLFPGTDSASAVKVYRSRRSSNSLVNASTLKHEDQNSNLQQTSIQTLTVDNGTQIPVAVSPNIVNFTLEPSENSPEPGNFLSDIELDEQDKNHVNTLSRFEVAELSEACSALKNTHMVAGAESVDDLTWNETVVENTPVDESLPSSSKFIDFSRANVPLGLPKFDDVSETEQLEQKIVSSILFEKNERQHKVLIEDSKDNTFITDLNIHDLIKLKTEPFADITEDDPEDLSDMCNSNAFISDSENEIQVNSAQIKDELSRKKDLALPQIFSTHLVVKLSRLLEYNCVPCDKTIFASGQREILQHSRTHQKIVIKKETLASKKRKSVPCKSEEEMKGSYNCLYCENKFVRCGKLVEHCLKKHPGHKPLKCALCPEMFTCFKNLRDHKAKVHNLLPIVDPNANNDSKCELCGKKFSSQRYVKYHILSMHQERKLQCEFCCKLFFKMKDLEIHKMRHLGMKRHLCEECGKAFVTPHELTDHIDRVHKKINRRKRRKTEIKKDSTTHPFSCKSCPYVFKKESAMKAHFELHDPQRKYSCDECGLRFKIYTNLKTHYDYKHKKNGKRNIVITAAEN